MAYAKFDDIFAEHPKVAVLSDAAFRTHVRGILYSNRVLSDGFVPRSVARELGRAVKELVNRGLWEEVQDGYAIHDFLDWNDSAQTIRSKRDSKRMAGAIGAASRWGDSKTVAQGVERSGEGSGGSKSKTTKQGVAPTAFDEFWAVYPRKDDKARARRAFVNAQAKAPFAAILAGAEAYRDDPNRVAEYTKHAATWLNAGSWENGPLPPRSGGNVSDLQAWMDEASKVRRG